MMGFYRTGDTEKYGLLSFKLGIAMKKATLNLLEMTNYAPDNS